MKQFSYLVFTFLLLAACTENADVITVGETSDSTVVWIDSLKKIDQDLLVDETMNTEKGWLAFQAFRDFARKNPTHPMAPYYHMKAASIARNIPGKSLMAIEEYSTVFKNYPQDSLAAQAQFLVGFTFDQNLNDNERAIKAFTFFIDNYPEHPLAQQAREMVRILAEDTDDLEMVKNWEAQAKAKANEKK